MRAPALLLAALLLAPAALPGAAAERVEAGFSVTEDRLDAGVAAGPLSTTLGTRLLRPASPDASALDVLLVFTQPALRGETDVVAIVGVAPRGGSEWRGLHWVESSEGATRPEPTTVGAEGRIFLLHAPASPTGAALEASYVFLGPNGTRFSVPLPQIPVMDAMPQTGGAVLAAAAVGAPRAGLPRLVAVAVWNGATSPLPMGAALLDADGRAILEVAAGGCRPETYDARDSEPGCRAVFLLERDGAAVGAWHEESDGSRVVVDAVGLHALDAAPYVRGSG